MMPIKLEDAAKCPKCGVVGALSGVSKAYEKGAEWDVCTYICVTELCLWFNTGWAVMSDKNGIVYEREIGDRGMDKTFQPITNQQLAVGRRMVEDAIRSEHNHG